MHATALLLDGFGDAAPLRLGSVEVPAPGPGEVHVSVRRAGVNPVDAKTRSGHTAPADARFPMVLGWDGSGTVAAAGSGAEELVGTRVAFMTPQVVDQRGTFASDVVIASSLVAPIPDGLDDDRAAAVPLSGLTAAQGFDMLGLREGQTLAVSGALGAVGRFAVALAVSRGIRVAAVVRDHDVDRAAAYGAIGVAAEADVPAGVQAALDGPADAALNLVAGTPAHTLLEAVRDDGVYVNAIPPFDDPAGPSTPTRGIVPRQVYVRARAADLQHLLELVASGAIDVPIADVLPLAEGEAALDRVAAGGLHGKLVLSIA